MKRALLITSLLSLAALGLAWTNFPLAAQLPSETISFSARLLDASGQPLNASSISIVVSVYDVPTGGAPLFTEAQTLSVTNGLLALAIGATQPLPATLFADLSQRYVGIQVGSDGEMSPRIPLTSVPFANVAQTALTTLAGGGLPAGAITLFGGSLPPAGFLLCDGTPVSRSQYAALFAAIGTTYGAGDGSSTFNLPDLRQRFPLGQGLSGTGSTLGSAGGQIDHTHLAPAHAHAIPQHSHSLSAHTHVVPAHAHSMNHSHVVPSHHHGKGDLSVGPSGQHVHQIPARDGGSSGSVFALLRASAVSAANYAPGRTEFDPFTGDFDGPTHTHPSSAFSGRVGDLGGPSGDSSFSTQLFSGSTGTVGDQSTSGPSIGNSGLSPQGEFSGIGGEISTGQSNPPFLTVNFIIKA